MMTTACLRNAVSVCDAFGDQCASACLGYHQRVLAGQNQQLLTIITSPSYMCLALNIHFEHGMEQDESVGRSRRYYVILGIWCSLGALHPVSVVRTLLRETGRPIKSEIYCGFMQMQLLITLRRFRYLYSSVNDP